MNNRPIGVFDSGVGGLTVLKEIAKHLPDENFIYFGDTARVPYGTKSNDTVIAYTRQDIRFLCSMGVKVVVAACNTASAVAIDDVKDEFDIPVLGVINAGAVGAAKVTKNKRIGIIGTSATVSSKAYEKALLNIDTGMRIYSKACPLFVPLVEEGWTDNDIAYRVAQEYLQEFEDKDIDTLILGCTHYPLLADTIQKVMSGVNLVNPAAQTAKQLTEILLAGDMANSSNSKKTSIFYLSDTDSKFELIARKLLNDQTISTNRVNIEEF